MLRAQGSQHCEGRSWQLSEGHLTITPALPSAPGRPREPGLPCKERTQGSGIRETFHSTGQSLLTWGIISSKRKILLHTKPRCFTQMPRECTDEHTAKIGQHCFQTHLITYQTESH